MSFCELYNKTGHEQVTLIQLVVASCKINVLIYYLCAFLTVSFALRGMYAQMDKLELFVHDNCGNVGMETVGMVSLASLEFQTVICLALGTVQKSHCRSPLPAHCPGLENVTTHSKVCVCSPLFFPSRSKEGERGREQGGQEEAVKHIESPKFMCPIFQPCWSQFTPVI